MSVLRTKSMPKRVTTALALAWILMAGGASVWGGDAAGDQQAMLKERRRLLSAAEQKGAGAVPTLTEALRDERELVRRTAAHLLADAGEPAVPGLAKALESPDYRIRLVAIQALAEAGHLPEYWSSVLTDDHPAVQRVVKLSLLGKHGMPEGKALDRLLRKLTEKYRVADLAGRKYVIDLFAKVEPLPPSARRLLIEATTDKDAGVREVAYEAILMHINKEWPRAAEILAAARADDAKRIRGIGRKMRWELKQVDHRGLPRGGWRFKIDPDDVGRDRGWYRPDFDDSAWRTDVRIKTSWQKYIKGLYHGAAWYRRSLRAPKAGAWDKAVLHFEGVDEEAWVWLNGQYVGEHAEGPDGWSEPFLLDVTAALKPGKINHITVLAKNTAGNGGIYAPLWLRLLDSDALE